MSGVIGEVAKRRAAITAATAAGNLVFPVVGGIVAGAFTGFFMSGNPIYLAGIGWMDEANDLAQVAGALADNADSVSDAASVTSDVAPTHSSSGTYADNNGHGNPNDTDIQGNRPMNGHGNPTNGTVYGPAVDGYGNPR
jgi:hypothetical protein